MEDCHRKVILDNIDELMEFTDYDKLMEECVKARILSPVMRNVIEEIPGADQKAKHRQLFIKLTKRGPTAYNEIVSILEKLKFSQAAKILRPGVYSRDEYISITSRKNTGFTGNKKTDGVSNNNQHTSRKNTGFTGNKKTDGVSNNNQNTDGCKVSIDSAAKNDNIDLRVFEDVVNCSLTVKKSKEIHHDDKITAYIMQSQNRGIFFLVNIIDFHNQEKRRNGSDIDADALIHLFREMGFIIFYYENLRQDKFHQLLVQLLDSEYARLTECFVMCIMSHGNMGDGIERVEFFGGSVENLRNITDKFQNTVCRNLIGKPKILIFPFCRGEISDRGLHHHGSPPQQRIETDHIDVKLPTNIPSYSDILICYASVPGFKTHRDPDKGSWYIQKLCEIFAEHAHDTHIEDLLKLVGEETGLIRTTDYKLQTSSTVNYGFFRKLYFNPGYYEN